MLFREIITVYTDSHVKTLNKLGGINSELLNIIAAGTYNYHQALNG
jgi:hypothetical protein